MQLKRSGPAPSQKADGRANVCPPPSTSGPRRATSTAQRVEVLVAQRIQIHPVSPFSSGVRASGRPAADRELRRRQAQDHQHRLGDLQSRFHAAQGKGPAGEGIRQGRHRHPLGADARLQQGAGIPQRRLDRLRLDRGLGGAARQDQRQSDQVDLRLFAAGMDRAGHHQGFADHQDRGSQGQARRGDARHRPAHLPGARAAEREADREGHHAGAAAASGRQDRAHSRRRRRPGPVSIR